MTLNEYQYFTRRTVNPDLDTAEKRIHGTLMLASEAGEVAGILQKSYQGHPVDREHLREELGDCLYCIAYIADCFGLTLENTAEANVAKLKKRYPNGFSADRSVNRNK